MNVTDLCEAITACDLLQAKYYSTHLTITQLNSKSDFHSSKTPLQLSLSPFPSSSPAAELQHKTRIQAIITKLLILSGVDLKPALDAAVISKKWDVLKLLRSWDKESESLVGEDPEGEEITRLARECHEIPLEKPAGSKEALSPAESWIAREHPELGLYESITREDRDAVAADLSLNKDLVYMGFVDEDDDEEDDVMKVEPTGSRESAAPSSALGKHSQSLPSIPPPRPPTSTKKPPPSESDLQSEPQPSDLSSKLLVIPYLPATTTTLAFTEFVKGKFLPQKISPQKTLLVSEPFKKVGVLVFNSQKERDEAIGVLNKTVFQDSFWIATEVFKGGWKGRRELGELWKIILKDDSSNDVISQRPQLQPPKRSTAKPPLAS